MTSNRLQVLSSVVFYIVISAISGCARSPQAAAAPPRPLPDFAATVVGERGAAPFSRADLLGRTWVVDFVYTRCQGPCPTLSANMSRLQKSLPDSVGLLSFTVDPDHDAPAVLARYARRFGADSRRWLFATGDKAALMKLYRDGFLIPVAESAAAAPGQNIAHTTTFVLLDRRARVLGYYDGEDASDLARLSAAAAALSSGRASR